MLPIPEEGLVSGPTGGELSCGSLGEDDRAARRESPEECRADGVRRQETYTDSRGSEANRDCAKRRGKKAGHGRPAEGNAAGFKVLESTITVGGPKKQREPRACQKTSDPHIQGEAHKDTKSDGRHDSK